MLAQHKDVGQKGSNQRLHHEPLLPIADRLLDVMAGIRKSLGCYEWVSADSALLSKRHDNACKGLAGSGAILIHHNHLWLYRMLQRSRSIVVLGNDGVSIPASAPSRYAVPVGHLHPAQ